MFGENHNQDPYRFSESQVQYLVPQRLGAGNRNLFYNLFLDIKSFNKLKFIEGSNQNLEIPNVL